MAKVSALLSAMVFAIGALACGPAWRVVHFTPDGLVGQHHFVVMPIDFRYLRVGDESEDAYLANKTDDKRLAWVANKRTLNAAYIESLIAHSAKAGISVDGPAGQADLVIRPEVAWLEPGWGAGVVHRDGEMRMQVRITDAEGTDVDVITIEDDARSLHGVARKLGAATADYLEQRVRN